MHKNINPIIQIFPEYEEKINFLFQSNEDFQDLCEDYLLCVSNVLEMKKETNKNSAYLLEYKDLESSLQQEIMRMIIKSSYPKTSSYE